MIYTVTFNPALDYVVTVNHFTLGRVNRTVRENIFYGGKGINVSALLANLGYKSTALGFVAGFTGDEIERGVKELGFQSDFIKVGKGMSRINLKLKSDEESEINGMGPEITAGDVKVLFDKLSGLEQGDVLVLSGSIPACMDADIYERIMEMLDGRGIQIVVDAEKDLLLNVLKYHPFLIKPNNHELGQMFGVTVTTDEDIAAYAGKLQEMGAVNVLVSMAKDGAILVAEDGSIYRQGVARGTVKNSVGAGDSMVAGFIAGYLETGDYRYALKLGTACGGATAFSDGIGTRQDIMKLMETL
ncbi:1-phosphofructokinase [Lachnoclostridium pacaense]|uniref:1-phosphofructokinase n=1 Tax=Enterocloster hominis (ex Hitch et al. 2024) TaxID=1917870 RepID=UPI001D1186FE|nr:1-phosphofructokinase [Lachnoclostridium pacaense]MCC2876385.1 1-phosphofructokinase [Lachnoclostridium pacaense]